MVYFKLEFGKEKSSDSILHANAESGKRTTGWEWVNAEVGRMKVEGKFKTAANYLTAARSWTKFLGRENWRFSETNASLTEKYQRWLSERGICLNTISAYMRALRVMYHRAMGNSGTTYDQCSSQVVTDARHKLPFANVFTGRAKTSKRSVTEKDIQQLYALTLASGSSLALARDVFLFSFYAMGMPFVDIAYLRKSNVKEGIIQYVRHKTGQPIRVAILAPMRTILERYSTSNSDFVFPILSEQEQSPEVLHRLYRKKLRQYNYSLHRLSEMLNVSRPLSSYVVRHSWASIAYRHHVDISLIGKALGHTKTSTTLLYIKSLFDPDLASANQKLMQDLGLC